MKKKKIMKKRAREKADKNGIRREYIENNKKIKVR